MGWIDCAGAREAGNWVMACAGLANFVQFETFAICCLEVFTIFFIVHNELSFELDQTIMGCNSLLTCKLILDVPTEEVLMVIELNV